jgi:heat-inducible transcriptional repressor
MSFENLSERGKNILQALIDYYIATAQPVGSRVLANKFGLGISPATIRNSMQDLEELGLVKQPHTSAGRVPTDTGYRVYVDELLEPEDLGFSEKRKIEEEISVDYAAIEELLEQTARALGNVSQELGVILSPRFDKGILTRIDLIPVAEKKILVVLTVKSGLIRTILLEAESNLETLALDKTQGILNERLCGLTLRELMDSMEERLKDSSDADTKLLRLFLDSKETLLTFQETEQLHLGGTINIVHQPEFKDKDVLSSFIALLEEKKILTELVSTKGINKGIAITIGKELERGEVQSLSLVTSRYQAGEVSGTIGIIGPTRMRYGKLVSLVDYTAKLLSKILSE